MVYNTVDGLQCQITEIFVSKGTTLHVEDVLHCAIYLSYFMGNFKKILR